VRKRATSTDRGHPATSTDRGHPATSTPPDASRERAPSRERAGSVERNRLGEAKPWGAQAVPSAAKRVALARRGYSNTKSSSVSRPRGPSPSQGGPLQYGVRGFSPQRGAQSRLPGGAGGVRRGSLSRNSSRNASPVKPDGPPMEGPEEGSCPMTEDVPAAMDGTLARLRSLLSKVSTDIDDFPKPASFSNRHHGSRDPTPNRSHAASPEPMAEKLGGPGGAIFGNVSSLANQFFDKGSERGQHGGALGNTSNAARDWHPREQRPAVEQRPAGEQGGARVEQLRKVKQYMRGLEGVLDDDDKENANSPSTWMKDRFESPRGGQQAPGSERKSGMDAVKELAERRANKHKAVERRVSQQF